MRCVMHPDPMENAGFASNQDIQRLVDRTNLRIYQTKKLTSTPLKNYSRANQRKKNTFPYQSDFYYLRHGKKLRHIAYRSDPTITNSSSDTSPKSSCSLSLNLNKNCDEFPVGCPKQNICIDIRISESHMEGKNAHENSISHKTVFYEITRSPAILGMKLMNLTEFIINSDLYSSLTHHPSVVTFMIFRVGDPKNIEFNDSNITVYFSSQYETQKPKFNVCFFSQFNENDDKKIIEKFGIENCMNIVIKCLFQRFTSTTHCTNTVNNIFNENYYFINKKGNNFTYILLKIHSINDNNFAAHNFELQQHLNRIEETFKSSVIPVKTFNENKQIDVISRKNITNLNLALSNRHKSFRIVKSRFDLSRDTFQSAYINHIQGNILDERTLMPKLANRFPATIFVCPNKNKPNDRKISNPSKSTQSTETQKSHQLKNENSNFQANEQSINTLSKIDNIFTNKVSPNNPQKCFKHEKLVSKKKNISPITSLSNDYTLTTFNNIEQIFYLKLDVDETYNLGSENVSEAELLDIPNFEFLPTNVQYSDIF